MSYGEENLNENFSTTSSPFRYSFNGTGSIVAAVVFISLCIFALIANSATLAVVTWSPKLRSPFHRLIGSLCVSDLVSSFFSLLELYRRTLGFYEWGLPDELCKILWGVKFWTMVVTSLHIVVFTVIRFLSIRFPQSYLKLKQAHVKTAIGVMWLVGFLVGFVPGLMLTEVTEAAERPDTIWPSCTITNNNERVLDIYIIVGYVFFIYVPILLVTLFSIGIALQIVKQRRTREKLMSHEQLSDSRNSVSVRRKKENQGILQLSLITGSFLLGYVPYSAYHIYSIHSNMNYGISLENNSIILGKDWWIAMTVYFLLRVSECLNPIFYNVASSKMRQETKNMFRKCCCH